MQWQSEVFAKGATTVDVLLKPFWLPQNAKLTIFDGTGKQIWGPFGHEQNNLANTLPLPLPPAALPMCSPSRDASSTRAAVSMPPLSQILKRLPSVFNRD